MDTAVPKIMGIAANAGYTGSTEPETVVEALDALGGVVTGMVDATKLSGMVPSECLPSYVDDVVEAYYDNGAFYEDSAHTTQITGEAGKIYVDLHSNGSYRLVGNAYIKIASPLEIATQSEAETGTDDTKTMTPLKTKQAIGKLMPTMSASTAGGAKLGLGLTVDAGALNVGALAKPTNGAIYGPLASVAATGWAEQDGIPTPSAPVPVVCANGRNLVDDTDTSKWRVGGFNQTGGESTSSNRATNTDTARIPLVPGGTYTLTTAQTHKAQLYVFDSSGTLLNNKGDNFTTPTHVTTFTVSASASYGKLLIGRVDNASMTLSDMLGAQLQLESGSTATPYVPYGCVGLRAKGKNLAKGYAYSNTVNNAKFEYNADGRFRVSGTPSANTSQPGYDVAPSDAKFTLQAGSYVMSYKGTLTNAQIQLIDTGGTAVTTISSDAASSTFTVAADTTVYVRIHALKDQAVNADLYLQIELGSTATPYERHYDWTASVPLPPAGFAAALPDGTADELAIDAAGHVVWVQRVKCDVIDGVNLGAKAGNATENGGFWAESSAPANGLGFNDANNLLLCDKLTRQARSATMQGIASSSSGNSEFRVTITSLANATQTEVNTWLASNPLTVYYPLATPIIHDLGYITPPAIYGEGTASIAELEDFEVESWVDEGGAVNALAEAYHTRTLAEVNDAMGIVAPVEGATASTNYSVGGYLVRDGKLCKVTSAIATGEAITIGTNVTTTNVMAEVLSLTS